MQSAPEGSSQWNALRVVGKIRLVTGCRLKRILREPETLEKPRTKVKNKDAAAAAVEGNSAQ